MSKIFTLLLLLSQIIICFMIDEAINGYGLNPLRRTAFAEVQLGKGNHSRSHRQRKLISETDYQLMKELTYQVGNSEAIHRLATVGSHCPSEDWGSIGNKGIAGGRPNHRARTTARAALSWNPEEIQLLSEMLPEALVRSSPLPSTCQPLPSVFIGQTYHPRKMKFSEKQSRIKKGLGQI